MKDSKSLSYQALVSDIFRAVRDKARRLSEMDKNGKVKVSLRPYVKEADSFFGGIGDFDRHQHVGPGGCVPLPDDLVVYQFEKPLVIGMVESKIILHPAGKSVYTLSNLIKKRGELRNTEEGQVFAQKDWAQISVTVSGGRTQRESLECASALNEVVEQFVSDYARLNGYEKDVFSISITR